MVQVFNKFLFTFTIVTIAMAALATASETCPQIVRNAIAQKDADTSLDEVNRARLDEIFAHSHVTVPAPETFITKEQAQQLIQTYGSAPYEESGRKFKKFGTRAFANGFAHDGTYKSAIDVANDEEIFQPLIPALQWLANTSQGILAPIEQANPHKMLVVESVIAIIKAKGATADSRYIHVDENGQLFAFLTLEPFDDDSMTTRFYKYEDVLRATEDYDNLFWTLQERHYENVSGPFFSEFKALKSESLQTPAGHALFFPSFSWNTTVDNLRPNNRFFHGAPFSDWRGRQPRDRITVGVSLNFINR